MFKVGISALHETVVYVAQPYLGSCDENDSYCCHDDVCGIFSTDRLQWICYCRRNCKYGYLDNHWYVVVLNSALAYEFLVEWDGLFGVDCQLEQYEILKSYGEDGV